MSIVHSVILGIIQGLTELLPISSKTHLLFAEHLFRIDPRWRVPFTVLLQLGTTIALIIFFIKPIARMIAGLFSRTQAIRKENWNMLLLLAIGSIPVGIAGYLLKDRIDALFTAPAWAGVLLLVTGCVLFLTRKTDGTKKKLSATDALVIGVAQAVALMPGISRSGFTISAALFLGVARAEAFDFSFLLAIPAILGASLLKVQGSGMLLATSGVSHLDIAAGLLASAAVCILALKALKGIVLQRRFWFFSFYCWALGVFALIYFHFRPHG